MESIDNFTDNFYRGNVNDGSDSYRYTYSKFLFLISCVRDFSL